MKDCKIEDKFNIRIMIDIDATDYYFINKVIAHKICELIEISSVKLLKSKNVRAYNDRKNTFITHVIYSFLRVEDYLESIISIMITKLDQ
jgi:hypothetical protein